MKLWILAGVALAAMLVISSCGGITFTAANAPTLFGDFDRRSDVAYGAGARQRLDVYMPELAPADGKARPIIVFWYGGAWESGRKENYRFVGAALAEAGYVAVLPDYRLFPEARFPAFLDDAAGALAWVVSHGAEIGGDPGRIYLAGHSAGAHLAAMLAYDTRRLERLGLQPDVVRGFIGLSGPYALDPNSEVLNTIFAAPYGFDDWQPVRRVHAGAPPALLLHGDADDVVAVSHSTAMAKALEAAGSRVALRIYPGRGHTDTVAAFAPAAPRKLPVISEIERFVGGERPGGVAAGHEREAGR